MSKNTALDEAIKALPAVESARDLRWLAEELHARQNARYTAKMHGIPGGHDGYSWSRELTRAYDLAARLAPDDLATLALVVDLAYRLMQPLPGDEARGSVQLKTIIKRFPVIDWAETGDSPIPVYMTDENGQIVKQDFPYTYAYIRQYAGKGNADRQRAALLSLYADRGMGKGGHGGYVAAALDEGLITKEEILDAWNADPLQGKGSYQQFIDHCADLLADTSGGPGQQDET